MSEFLEKACVAEFHRICPLGFAAVVNITELQYDWVEFHYPQPWINQYIENEFILDDPTLIFAKDRTGHVTWEDLREEFPGNRVMEEAREFGLTNGSTLVLDFGGIRSVASGAGKVWTQEDVETLTVALTTLHGLFAKPRKQVLSDIQVEIIRLMAQGHRDSEIAERLGLKPVTIRKHRGEAHLATGTKTPAQLTALAVRGHLI